MPDGGTCVLSRHFSWKTGNQSPILLHFKRNNVECGSMACCRRVRSINTRKQERGKGAGLKRGRESTYMHGLSFSRWVSVGGFPSVNRSSFILFPFSIFLLLLTSTCGCLWEAQLTNKIQLGNATFNWWPHKRERICSCFYVNQQSQPTDIL